MRALKLQPISVSLADRLADLAVDALIDEADLSPKPALVDRQRCPQRFAPGLDARVGVFAVACF